MTINTIQPINADVPPVMCLYSDATWQNYFVYLRDQTIQLPDKYMKGDYVVKLKIGEQYKGETQAARYKAFINDVLRTMRNGQHDCCFHVYQIKDLLKYEKERLRTKYVPEGLYFEVWLSDR